MARGKLAVTLVHGTWGRGIIPRVADPRRPRWFEPGSNFVLTLVEGLQSRGMEVSSIDYLSWSGANSFRCREQAAKKLADQLDKLAENSPDSTRLIVGHSHGGNVCLRAFAHVGQPTSQISVVTLATPFVELVPSKAGSMLITRFIAAFAGIAFALQLAEPFLGLARSPLYAVLLIAALAALAVGLPIAMLTWGRLARLAARLVEISSHEAYRMVRPYTLVIRGIDDEAALTLALGAVVGRVTYLATVSAAYASIVVRWIFLGGGIAGITIGLAWPRAGDFIIGAITAIFFGWFGSIVVALFAAVGIAALARGLAPAVYGRELLLTYPDVAIKSDSAPDATGSVSTATLPPPVTLLPGLRHSLHSHPECVTRIVEWIAPAETLDGSTAPQSGNTSRMDG